MVTFTKQFMFAALVSCLVLPVYAEDSMGRTVAVSAMLSAASEVPANASTGMGTLDGRFDKDTRMLRYSVSYAGLTGPVKAGHFHGPAMAGANAGVALPLDGSLDSPISGSATLTPAQAADLLDGKWYINLHTATNPGGEIRGQVLMR